MYLMLFYSSLYSFSRNSIYSIHYTYYSLAVSGLLSCFFMIVFLFLCECFMFSSKYNLVVFSLLCFVLNFDSSFFGFLLMFLFLWLVYFFLSLGILYSFSLLSLFMFLFFVPLRFAMLCFMLFIFIFFLFMWINDIITECSFVFTSTEQLCFIYGIKLLILSEFMLFFCLFWTEFNFRFILSVFSCFYALPLLSSFCFAIPYTNVIVLLFSSLPIQATIIFYKVGLFYSCIEQLGQTVSCGTVFLVLQLKEFFYSFHSITDCMIGSIFYFTTGLHGFHVLAGLFYFYLILCVYFFSILFNISFFGCMVFSSMKCLIITNSVINKLINKLFFHWLHDILFYLFLLLLCFDSSLNSAYYSKHCATFLWALLCSIDVYYSYLTAFIKLYCFCDMMFLCFCRMYSEISGCILSLIHLLTNLAHLAQTTYVIRLVLINLFTYVLFNVTLLYFSLSWSTRDMIGAIKCSKNLFLVIHLFQTKNNNKYAYFYIEFNESLFYSSYYWHFVDLIWLIVFILYFF